MKLEHVLVVDDDPLSREFLAEAVRELGHSVEAFGEPRAALERLRQRPFDLLITDLRMPDMDGLELLRAAAEVAPGMPGVLVTAHGTIRSAVEAMQLGAVDFLMKPVAPEALELVLGRIARTARLEAENAYLRAERTGDAPQLVARSRAMLETLEAAGRVAASKGTVLITGESGTGKERVAQFIHDSSPRREQAFIRVNCAALSEQLLESELFGHERGAFTGAHRRREGRFELADGGTLLLDEIGEISPALQVKLLRVLEEEEFERVGGSQTLQVDVRIIAATNRDLPTEVAAGRFREDLYYRLHVLPVHIAPLRGRTDDIAPLAEHFARHYARLNGARPVSFSPDALARLASWSWPGNVRELENVVQRAVVLTGGGTLQPADLSFGSSPGTDDMAATEDALDRAVAKLGDLLANRKLADIEREAILATLEETGGNKTEAARRLGVTARTLSNKFRQWRAAGLLD
ncbi:sigma-54-dependent transcriptional regulator [Engelhardtia mirabilis]|uniref:Transcriptional regulatory protein ZraR n=1 Tax=Engelhardtia mirabilis TaxID=2528011 RepID=A0A518BSR9_9BACT|nr:Transcriptional regulatory protein ZraR [Planctomycetes bacterium Pla133]QDV04347.1 Transcriptional regulatory protein ZraR [Planctomycetes bacterium Pla86]